MRKTCSLPFCVFEQLQHSILSFYDFCITQFDTVCLGQKRFEIIGTPNCI